MRLFLISDLHVDYPANARWVDALSRSEHRSDWIIVAGDLSHREDLLLHTLSALRNRFARVLFVPGNHDLWLDKGDHGNSLEKLDRLTDAVQRIGIDTQPVIEDGLAVVPLLSWYDYSFGEVNDFLTKGWMDYLRCRWPVGYDETTITAHLCARNPTRLAETAATVISFSHFLPRPDVFPRHGRNFLLLPILGTVVLDMQLRALGASVHAFGHSHLRVDKTIDGVRYVNNAYGYPREHKNSVRGLKLLHES